MPGPLVIPAISAGSQLASTAIGAAAQGKMNKKQRRWNEKMYAMQRADALTDWRMQNEYNSPMAQMQRLTDAGLNPNLVYGNGAEAQSGAMPRQTNVESWNPRPADFSGIGTAALGFMDTMIKQQTADNLEAQKTIMEQDALLKAAQINETAARTAKIGQDTEIGKATLYRADELAQTSLEFQKAQVGKTLADTTYTLDNNERAEAMQSQNIRESMERVLQLRMQRLQIAAQIKNTDAQTEKTRLESQLTKIAGTNAQELSNLSVREINARIESTRAAIQNLYKDAQLKQLDIDLKKSGLQPGDPLYMRALQRALSMRTE